MEKLNSEKSEIFNSKKSVDLNGYILSIQYQNVPPVPPVYSYVPFGSKLESIVSDTLKSHPGAIIFIQASTGL